MFGRNSLIAFAASGQSSTRFSNVGRVMAGLRPAVECELTQAAQVDGLAQNALRLLRSVEAHGVFRHDEVDHELSAPLVVAGLGQLFGTGLVFARFDV